MKHLYSILVLSLMTVLNLGAVDEEITTANTSSIEKYVNTEKHYAIEFPSDWKKEAVPKLDLVLFAPRKNPEINSYASLNVIAEKIGPGISLDQFYQESLSNLKTALTDVQIEKTGDIQLHGTAAKWVIYTHEMKDIQFRVLQNFIMSEETAYILTFSTSKDSFQEYEKDFQTIVNSFEILDKKK